MKKFSPLLFVLITLIVVGCETEEDKQLQNVSLSNPIESVTSAKEFEKIGITIDAPAGSTDISYSIIENVTAQVDFTLDNTLFNLRASTLTGNISGIYEKLISSEQFFIKNEIEVVVNTTASNTKIVHWQFNNLTFSLITTGDISNEALLNLVGDLCI